MPRIVGTRHVLAVRDLAAATRYYTEVLGFTRDFGDGSDGWSFLSRDECRVMLGECPEAAPAGDLGEHSWFAYLLVEEVDRLHVELAGRGAEVLSAPTTEPWGLREFSIRTPEGHRIGSASRWAGAAAGRGAVHAGRANGYSGCVPSPRIAR